MTATLRVGRLVVRGADGGRLGRDVVARGRAESLLAELVAAARRGGAPDRSVLVLRRLRWPLDRLPVEAARDEVAALWRAAIRPAATPTAAVGATAVVFADEVELLACLTRDAVTGRLDRWYWQRVVPDRSGGAVLAVAWTERARWLPAALAALPAGLVLQAVATLAEADADRVCRGVEAAFSGHLFEAGPAAGSWSNGRHRSPSDGSAGGRDDPASTAAAGRGRSLSPARRRLLELVRALAPRRAPAASRRPGTAPGRSPITPSDAPPSGPAQSGLEPSHVTARDPASPAVGSRGPTSSGTTPGAVASGAPDRGQQAGAPTTGPAPPPDDAGRPRRGAVLRTAAPAVGGPAEAPTPHADRRDHRSPAPAARPPDRAAFAPVHPAGADGVPSAAASALYLINLRPWRATEPGDQLSAWAALELCARDLLTLDQAPPDDPLWALLAELDGREPGSPPAAPADPASRPRWARAVGDALTRYRIDRAALARPGRLVLTRTHLDVVLALDDIDIAVRACGLDRDPGWVPDLGLIIAFHFVSGYSR